MREGKPIMSDWEQGLLSLENLDRSSPELWPEPIPGVTEYAARNSLSSSSVPKNIQSLHSMQMTEDDYKLLNFYSTLSKDALVGELKKLHDLAYKLGLEESKEMTRGRFLNVLSAGKKK